MTAGSPAPPPMYPPARQGADVDAFHGEIVPDPYRWLEDGSSEETRAWVAAENEATERFLAAVPGREAVRRRLAELWSLPRWGVPFERGGRWFQFRNTGLQDQDVVFVMESPTAEGGVLLDPNALSEDGTVAVTALSVSADGSLAAYGTSTGGSDWRTWRVRRVDDGEDLADVVEWSKYSSAAWAGDASGFFYGAPERPPAGAELRAASRALRILFHRLGTPQSEDEVVYFEPEQPDWAPEATVTADGRYLVVSVSRGVGVESQISVLDLSRPALGLRPLVEGFAAAAEVVTNLGQRFYVLTELGAERRRVVAIDLDDAPAGPAAWKEVIGESDATLRAVRHCGDALICHYLVDAHASLGVYALDGAHRRDVALPGLVSVAEADLRGEGIEGRPGQPLAHFQVRSFLEQGSIWSLDVASGESCLVRPSPAGLDPEVFLSEQVHVSSADGTLVPMFVSRRRDVTRSGEVPVLLHGYGGFNLPMTPEFSPEAAVFMEGGGIYAAAVLRGGGEYGRSWHDAGRLASKQNVFDDFAACARWFAEEGWSRAERLAIHGASNGGLLVGASITQHPELFGAAVAEVGVLDMLRFHRHTIGWAWTPDFGDPEDPEQYKWLRAYSPLQRVEPGRRYPATLVMTGDHDDRVVPAHSYKFAAALQAASSSTPDAGPILLRVETSTGHGPGKPTTKQFAERADVLAFLEAALRSPVSQDEGSA